MDLTDSDFYVVMKAIMHRYIYIDGSGFYAIMKTIAFITVLNSEKVGFKKNNKKLIKN